jgi:hypothetical protein
MLPVDGMFLSSSVLQVQHLELRHCPRHNKRITKSRKMQGVSSEITPPDVKWEFQIRANCFKDVGA